MPKKPTKTIFLTLSVLFFVALPLAGGELGEGQSTPPSEMDAQALEELLALQRTEREDVRMVLLPTVVTTKKGRPVTGLKPEDFLLQEDFVPHAIDYFVTEAEQPVSIAFLLDLSGSMRQVGKLDEAKQSIQVFIDSLHEGDRFGLIGFADDQVSWITEFTSDRANFLARLSVQSAYGQTALFDALGATPTLVDAETAGRRAIVLITDGHDNASTMNSFKAMQLARLVQVPIYTVAFTTFADRILPKGGVSPGIAMLQRFSKETGGRLFSVGDPDDLKDAVLEIQRELRFQYVIGYHSQRTAWDGRFRRIRLDVERKGLTVRTRSGYYANP